MIVRVRGREVLDSRGRPTVEVELALNDGTTVIASVPSGASRGRHEAVERRDGDPSRYGGRGVRGAVAAIEGEIAEFLTGREPDQRAIDGTLIELDGTRDKSRLGANAILAVSLAVARAAAARDGVPLWRSLAGGRPVTLPMPMVNIISGGLHAGRQLDFQDFLAIPAGAGSYSQALEWVVRIHAAAGALLAERGLTTLRADEGGYGPPLDGHRGALRLLDQAVVQADLRLGDDVVYGVDVAATHFFSQGSYALASEGRTLSPAEIADYVAELARDHPIASVEDPLAEDDWEAWAGFTARLGDRFQVVGDDLFTTNIERLERGIAERSANAVLVKMNQIGTISETLDVVVRAKQAGFRTVISARSGETEDPALADLAVGCDGGQIKVGSVTQSERLAKYNQLLRIEQELGDDAVLAPWGRVG
jgi:enolase